MVYSTAVKPTKEKLKKVFAEYGTPEVLESDNGPPFNSRDFADFAMEEGFRHHKITPLHPQANGEAESFMKLLNKTEKRSRLENKSVHVAIQELLTGYRSTPHPATGVSPYQAMMNRQIRTKLDYTERDPVIRNEKENNINERDKIYKMKIKNYAENKNTRVHTFTIGDYVLLEQKKINKWTTPYEPEIYIVYNIKGSSIWARRLSDGREVCRDSTCFKHTDRQKINRRNTTKGEHNGVKDNNWRETTLRKARVGKPNTASVEQHNQIDNELTDEPIAETGLRRSQRIRQRPKRYGDFIYY